MNEEFKSRSRKRTRGRLRCGAKKVRRQSVRRTNRIETWEKRKEERLG
jgi:hypothetical protein